MPEIELDYLGQGINKEERKDRGGVNILGSSQHNVEEDKDA